MAEKSIALTFDDGPNNTTTVEILDLLEKYGVTASFFLIGINIGGAEGTVRRAYDMGCEIGCHSKTHRAFTELSAAEAADEIAFTSEKIVGITGEMPRFFRPPYIAVNDAVIAAVDMPLIAGYGARDWENEVTAEMRADAVLSQAKDGAIILLHDAEGNSMTVEALRTIIPALLEQGFEFVTVSELFRRSDAEPKAHDGIIYSFAGQKTMFA